MDRLYLPPSLRYFEPKRVVPREPFAHTSLAYDLVEALRPRLVVDIGVGAGVAMAALCQAMRDHDVDGLVYGVDAWDDDGGKADDDPTRWADLNGFLRAHYRGVAYLLKMASADALQHFAPGSVGLLRLNAVRAGGPLTSLLAEWAPKVAPGGVILCPGVNDPERAEIGEAWQREMAPRGGVLFAHGKGLGLFRVPSEGEAPASELVGLLASPDADERASLARFYQHADRHHTMRIEILGTGSDLRRQK